MGEDSKGRRWLWEGWLSKKEKVRKREGGRGREGREESELELVELEERRGVEAERREEDL